ncbi:MAG: YqeG family HAD IIIA-type phosphatase [Fimbriimonadaceae bacterium]|nr:YqeG family HAD IIIA-type phosphatase [Fimbriimonadaceae bacterium]
MRRHPGIGSYERDRMPGAIRRVSPASTIHRIIDIDPQVLVDQGKRLVLLDVDNTLLPWKSKEIPPDVAAWVERGRELGLQHCILSNTRHPERLEDLAGRLGIPFERAKFKPSREMYVAALERFHVKPEQAVMVGDQLFTDVLGANRSGIDAIWVQRLDRREFLGTKLFSRTLERLVGMMLSRWFVSADGQGTRSFLKSRVLGQLIRFAIVGAVCTVVDLGLHFWLLGRAQWGGMPLSHAIGGWVIDTLGLSWPKDPGHLIDAAWIPTKVGPVALAILTSYLLNFAWTFRDEKAKPSALQAGRFYLVALVGLLISTLVSFGIKRALTGSFERDFALASLVGMVAGFLWNFNGQRIFTFGAHRKP